MRGRTASCRGFTTIELMVASAILAIVTVHVLATFSNQMATYTTQKRISDVQEDARLAAEIMVRDIRLSGFMVPLIVGISSRDGGATLPDSLCTSDSSVISDASLDEALDRFDGAPLTATLNVGADLVTVNPAALDIDGDTNDDFEVDRGIIVSDGVRTHCARITKIVGGVITFTPDTPVSVNVGAGRVIPAVIYELDASGLLRNGLLISAMVEDLQVEFAVDANGDGQIGAGEFPIHDLSGSVPSAVVGTQLSVLTRSDFEDADVAGPGRQAVANRTAGAPDGFRRRLVSVTTSPRNM